MIEGLVAGKLFGRPERRTSAKTGKQFVTAKVRAAAGDGEALFTNVISFDEAPQAALLALEDGDSVVLAGALTPKAWTDREGTARPSLDLVATQVLTTYHAKKKREAVAAAGELHQPRRDHQDRAPGDFGTNGDTWLAGGAA